MKYAIAILITLVMFNYQSKAQSNAEKYSAKVALRMKDSLSISAEQRIQIYNINMHIHEQKSNVWQQYSGSDSLIRIKLQEVENSRDSVYQPVLSVNQFGLYLQKKKVLLSNN